MRCPACQAVLPRDAHFCPSCGAAQATGGLQEVRKTVTVVFCDVADSTALSRRLDPEALRVVMLRYFAAMRDCVERRGGVVEKFIGDAVMAVFGVPITREDDALRAVRAAIEMRAALDDLNDELTRDMGVRIAIRIGVNTGEVVTSASPAGEQALAAGETVNVAARLQQHAAPGELLLGPQTHRAVAAAAAVVTEPAGPLQLKGLAEPITAYRLLDLHPDSPAAARRFDVPLVGRDTELRELELILDRAARDATVQVVTVYGDAGIGKSRLAREYTVLAAQRGVLTTTGRCKPDNEGASLLPLAEALRPLAGMEDGAVELGSDTLRAVASLREGLLRDGAPGTAVVETIWATCELLESLGRHQPVLLVIDDLQWAEDALLDALMRVAGQITDSAVVILCLARTDFFATRPDWAGGLPDARSLLLRPLGTAQCQALIQELSDVMAHDTAAVDGIVRRAEGNPLFVEQLVAIVSDGADPGALPPTISQLIAARLDLLDLSERTVAAMAAVAGREFTTAALRVISPDVDQVMDEARIDQALAALGRRRLIQLSHRASRSDVAYRFANGLIHQVTYDSLPKRLRARLHERLADWFEAQRSDPEAVGSHLERAYRNLEDLGLLDVRARELAQRGAGCLALVGGYALRHGDLRRAVSLLERALGLYDADDPRRMLVVEQLSEATIASGDTDSGQRLLREARAAAIASGDAHVAAHADLQLAYLQAPGHQIEASLSAATNALPIFEASEDDLGLARAWTRIGQARQINGRYGEAVEALERALEHATAADAELERATALGALAVSYWLGPEPVRSAIGRCNRLQSAHAEGRQAVRAALACPMAVLLAMATETERARELIVAAQKITDELSHAYAAATVPIFGATVESLAGCFEAAERMLRGAAQRCRELGDSQLYATAVRDLSRVLLSQGRTVEALELADATLIGQTMPSTIAELRGISARVLATRRQDEAARRLSREAIEYADRTDSLVGQAMARLDSAHVRFIIGEREAAREAAEQAWRYFTRKGHVVGEQWATDLFARR